MSDKLRWGVLSTANIGRKAVAPAIQASGNGVVLAVASRDADRAAAYAGEIGIPRHYAAYEALLNDPEIDAIYNPLPNNLHLPWTLRALEAGKHVLCEKPLGMTAQECLTMHRAAERAGRVLMEAFMYRFHPRLERVLERLAEAHLGQPRLVRSSFSFTVRDPANIRLQPELGGGALMDVGCYCVNVSRTLLGREPERAQALAVWSASGVDARLVGTLAFGDGVLAQFDCALDAPRREVVEVVGSEGYLTLESAFLPGTGETAIASVTSAGAQRETVAGADEYRLMVEHFAACALGGAAPRYGAREAAANLAVIEALYASARAGGQPQTVAGV